MGILKYIDCSIKLAHKLIIQRPEMDECSLKCLSWWDESHPIQAGKECHQCSFSKEILESQLVI